VLLLALSGMMTLVLTSARNAQFRQTRQWQIVAVQQTLDAADLEESAVLPAEVAYVAALTPPAAGTAPAPRYQLRYTAPTFPLDDLAGPAQADRQLTSDATAPAQSGGRTLDYLRTLTQVPAFPSRLHSTDQPGRMLPRYVAYRVSHAGQDYEIGFRLADDLRTINRANLQLILVLVTSSLLLWGTLRLFLHTNLVQPLTALLDGIRQAHRGHLHQQLPVRYEDEIGFLTHSFNTMMHSIHTAQAELRAANLHLEERVQQRTAELQQEMAALQQANQQIGEQQQAIAMLRERERLARELHDNLGQVLGYVNTQAQATRTALETDQVPQARELLDQIAGVSRSMLTDIREYILGVQVGTMLQTSEPIIPTSGAFVAALDTYMREFEQIWHIRTTLRLPPNAREVAFAPTIETHLFRVVQEALTNIRKHASASHVEVALQLPLTASEPTTAADTRELVITITDNGQGFAVHAHNGTAPSGGHGFGLTSMRGRVAEIGGTLTIESIPTAGTTLTVQVPLRRQGDITQQPVRLLLVDDNALFLRGLHSLLEVNGFQVVGTAGNGDEAQAQARTLEPDVILMDVQMPKCDGLAATRAIKADMPHIQIVMLTVSDDDAHLFEALRSGASGYLLKSLESEDLCTLLLGLMRGEVPFSPGLAARVLHELTHSDTSAGAAPPEQSALPEAHLTEQQITLLTLLAQGQTQQEVGERMGYTRRTISRHLATIIDMLHLCNRAEAIAYARQKLEQGDWPVPPGDEE
jgi:signal transduction histidine kinase/DNA-binding NarL/FixJ family response regulator